MSIKVPGTAGNGIGELLYFVKMVEHTDRGLHVPHDGGVSCPGGQVMTPPRVYPTRYG